ncbi:SpoIIE family protein phosphatase [Streptomyces sp. NPDC005236]|uniref:ATP-binding SpoIIE family protein phosphatase n=1 Tax=Streptomyces sp. NPDC005236 TaxID=3157028 RepID=UPI0033AD0E9E
MIGVDGEPAVSARDLLQAQQRALAALEELNRVRQAYEASEHSRHQALQVATVLFALLGHAQSQIAQLTRRLDALNETPAPVLEDISATHLRLGRAQAQEEDLRVQLARAEAERQKAQNLADIAARRIQALETELHDMRGAEGLGVPRATDAAVQLPDAVSNCSNDDAALDQVDAALQKARHVLDREHEVVEELAGELGWQGASPDRDLRTTVVPGQSRRQDSTAPDSNGGRRQRFSPASELSGTTLNNTVTRHSGPGADLAVRQAGDRMRFVGAATRRIARGIDLDEIVMGLCRATVPTFSDAILVYLRDPLPVGDERPTGPLVLRLRRTDRIPEERDTGSGFLLALRPEPSELSAMTAELCEVRPGGALAEVLRGVRPVFADAPAARAALPELLGDDMPVPSGQRAILAPLRGRRRVIGAALFLRQPERLAFEADDLLVAAQLATHSALSIENSIANFDASLSDELQRTMLPETLPRLMGVRLVSRYLPAAQTMLVGGDWYDAIPLPGSRVGLFVGDVMGHSRTSAAIMGQLRTTAQTLAGLDLPPQEVLHHLDEQAQRLGRDRMATCLYAVYDPVSHRITIANAGHPPPILLHLGGRAEVLRVPPGAPIGVGGVDFEAVELEAPAGATLLLYTDGLVESRFRDVWIGIEQLREKVADTGRIVGPEHPVPLEALCDEVLDMLGPGDRDDDIALLAARFDGIAPTDVAYWFLEPEDAAPGRARRLARKVLARWGMEDLTDSVELLVSEVVTNAVRYATRPVTLRLLRTDVLRCEVGDDVPQLPRMRQARATDEGGRGLFLVNRLARRWGVSRLSTGKVVWFEF